VLDSEMVAAVIADMAGKPFEYGAPMSSHAPVEKEFLKPVAVATVKESSVEPMAEPVAEPIVQPAAEPVASPLSNADVDVLVLRVASLEQRVAEQEAALRRVLSMMIDWMDRESSLELRFIQNSRAA
jgi:general secretion pathway protein A